ncbi:dienelactone hydrolase family protein [Sphingomonas sp. MS122]|uniref:dienelactone hydrolase family protein n=1 Tax=Sphingomonas sp. MS122 TaxID=3412683 RepID=UPI003C2D4334
MSNNSHDAANPDAGQVSRRAFLARAGVASAVGAATAGMATNAAAAILPGVKVKTFKGKYAVDSHRIVDGFMASPRSKTKLDVVVVVSESGALTAEAEATARRYAAQGWLAIAPNLPSTYRGAALAGKPAMVEALMRDVPRLERLARGSGKVAIVTA